MSLVFLLAHAVAPLGFRSAGGWKFAASTRRHSNRVRQRGNFSLTIWERLIIRSTAHSRNLDLAIWLELVAKPVETQKLNGDHFQFKKTKKFWQTTSIIEQRRII